MNPELIAILITALLQSGMLVASIVMLYKNFRLISENFRQMQSHP